MADEKETPSLAPDDWYQQLMAAIQKPISTTDAVELRRPIWLPDTKGFLAMAIVGLFGAAIFILMFKSSPADQTVFAVLTTLLGVLASQIKEISGYYYGSSASSTAKDDTIQKMAVSTGSTAAAATTAAAVAAAVKEEVVKNGAPHA